MRINTCVREIARHARTVSVQVWCLIAHSKSASVSPFIINIPCIINIPTSPARPSLMLTALVGLLYLPSRSLLLP